MAAGIVQIHRPIAIYDAFRSYEIIGDIIVSQM